MTWGSIDITPTETDRSQSQRRSRLRSHPTAIRVARFTLAGALSVGATDLLWHAVPGTLTASTDVVGYPIFADFDITRYFDAYYLIALVLPVLVLLFYHLLAWRGPLRKAREPRAIRPVEMAGDGAGSAPFARAGVAQADVYGYLARAARLVLPAATVALEVSSVRAPGEAVPTRAGWVAGLAYLVVVASASALAARVLASGNADDHVGRHARGRRAAAIVRSGAALCVVPLLLVVSHATSVTVGSEHRVVHYPWLPVWLVVAATAALVLWVCRRLVRSRSCPDAISTETFILTLIVGPILLFLCVASLPGAFGSFNGFDDGQGLAAARLTFHGFFPWKNLFFIHGLLADVFDPGIGLAVFANSRWGSYAGSAMFVSASTILVFYYFTVYFARRNRLLIFGVSVAMVLGLLGQFTDRFGFAPILVVLFDAMLRRRSRLWCGAFMVVLIIESIIVPETGLLAVGLLATLVVFEWFHRAPHAALMPAFFRTLWCLVLGAGLTVVWVGFLAVAGALSGFIDYYRIVGPGHTLSGALPTEWSLLHQPAVTLEFFLPVILLLLTIWRAVAKLRGRRTWSTRDWTMVAAGTWVVLYYGKALGRADVGHVGEVFTVTVPLLLLWVVDVLEVGDRAVARLWSRLRVVRVLTPRRLVTAAAIVAVVATAPYTVSGVAHSAAHFQAVVPAEPVVQRLGYSLPDAVDTTKLSDLATLLDRYAGKDGPVFDFTNDPGILYYLLGRVPATRFFHVSLAIPAFAQRLLVSELAQARPTVVIFDDKVNGLPLWDQVSNMIRHYDVSQYILDHYVPLVDADGTLVMLRADLMSHAAPLPALRGPSFTADLYFDAPACAWGDIPNFLHVPGEPTPGTAIRIPTRVVKRGLTTITGWAVDASQLRPAREVIAVGGGHVLATAVPQVARQDVAQSLKSDQVLVSGFTLALPTYPGPVQLYSLNRDDSVIPLFIQQGVSSAVVSPGTAPSVRTADGTVHRVLTGGPRGFVEGTTAQRAISLAVPPAVRLASYQWLELTLSGAVVTGWARADRRRRRRLARDHFQRPPHRSNARSRASRKLRAVARVPVVAPTPDPRWVESHSGGTAGALSVAVESRRLCRVGASGVVGSPGHHAASEVHGRATLCPCRRAAPE